MKNPEKVLDRGFNHARAVNPVGNNVVTMYAIGVCYAFNADVRAKDKAARDAIVGPWKASKLL